jgi:hypothetical protein
MEKLVFTISGKRGRTKQLFIDGKALHPERSLKVRCHSPTGFEWGYTGSGPAQTALAICLEIFPTEWMANALYQSFKFAFVCSWKDDEFTEVIELTNFLIDHRSIYEVARKQQDASSEY